MDDILDANEQPIKRGIIFSILGFICAVVISPIALYKNDIAFFLYQNKISPLGGIFGLISSVQYPILFSLIGLLSGVISLVRKEKLKLIQPIGLTLNLLWVILFSYYIYSSS